MTKTIMIVDDEQDIRDSVKTILEKEGYEIIIAINGDDCLKKIKEGASPDLILMDIMMPGTPVREIIPKLRNRVVYLSVVRTGEAEKEALMRSKNVVGFIQKPFDIKELIKKVKELVGK